MKNSNEIKARIKSIRETSHITKAMQMISVAKMRKALEKYEDNKAYNNLLKKSIAEIFAHEEKIVNPYTVKRRGNRTAYIVIAGDKGFAGDYNHKVLSLAYKDMQNIEEKHVFTIGHMSYDFFVNKGINIDIEFLNITNNPVLDDARKIMQEVLDLYNKDMMDEIRIVYTQVISNSVHEAVVEKLLPLSDNSFYSETAFKGKTSVPLEFNGKYNDVIDIVVKQYILGTIYSALIQSVVVEHYERMVAMDNATRNSKKMLDKLNLDFNKLRQEKITTEICETSVFLLKKD